MTEVVSIRKYLPADKDAVLALFRMNVPRYFAPAEEEDLRYYLDHHAENYFLLEQAGTLLGSGGFNVDDDFSVGKISWDIFHPEQQGKGLGTFLTKYRIEVLQAHPTVKTISVRTSQLAFGFYEKRGFVLQKMVKDYWAEGFDLYQMEYRS